MEDPRVIPAALANQILQVLAKQPFVEVRQLIPALQSIPKVEVYLEVQKKQALSDVKKVGLKPKAKK